MTPERLAELHESARYANAHGGGYVNIPATELLEVLPPLPVEEKAAEPEANAVPVAAEGTAEVPVAPIEPAAEAPTVPVPEPNAPEVAGSGIHAVAEVPAAEVAPAGAPIVETQTLSQEEISAQITWDKEHPTQEEQERAAATPAVESTPVAGAV